MPAAFLAGAMLALAAQPPAPAAPRTLDLAGHDYEAIDQLLVSPDGARVVLVGHQPFNGVVTPNRVTAWNVATGKLLYALDRGAEIGHELVASPDGRMLATAILGRSKVIVRDAATGKELWEAAAPDAESVQFSPDSRSLAVWCRGLKQGELPVLRIWDTATKVMRSKLEAPRLRTRTPIAAPDGRLYFRNDDGRVELVVDISTGNVVPAVRFPVPAFNFPDVSADGTRWLARDYWPILFGPDGKRLVTIARRPGVKYQYSSLSRDGKRVAAVAEGGRITVWDADTGAETAEFGADGVRPDINGDLWFTPDGRYIVAQWSGTRRGIAGVPMSAVFTVAGREVRRDRGFETIAFDPATRVVAVLSRLPNEKPAVTIHDAATWLAGGKKE